MSKLRIFNYHFDKPLPSFHDSNDEEGEMEGDKRFGRIWRNGGSKLGWNRWRIIQQRITDDVPLAIPRKMMSERTILRVSAINDAPSAILGKRSEQTILQICATNDAHSVITEKRMVE
jgi:hypothetical protein